MSYPAHIREDGAIQTVAQHCLNTGDNAGKDLQGVGLKNTAVLAGILHDAGKCSEEFKIYIEKASKGEEVRRGSVIHSFAGVRYLLNSFHSETDSPEKVLTAEILASAIGGHHGLFDCFDENGCCGFSHRIKKQPDYDDKAMKSFFAEVIDENEIEKRFCDSSIEVKNILSQIENISKNTEEACFYLALLTRLITSALIDADRSDTLSFVSPNQTALGESYNATIWDSMLRNYDEYLSHFEMLTPVQLARKELSDMCFVAADLPSGVYRLNLPTGAGKTLSGLRYALKHALRNGKKRVFFISPLLSILEQNAQQIRRAVKNDGAVLEHHSDIISEGKSEDELNQYELLTETWNSPIVITTLVQFLNTLFSGKTASVRRFHALTDSVIVIDEVQTIPLKMLSLFNLAVNFLSQIGGTTIVLCSATQPELGEINHSLLDCKEIVSGNMLKQYEKTFKRNVISYVDRRKLSEIPSLIVKLFETYQSVLVICNKKDQAAALFEMTEGVAPYRFHFSAGMCIEHRKKTLAEMTTKLNLKNDPQKVLCVSTQVIEAGVDISFDAVIRLCAGLDSIVQAAGRCNRNGERASDAPVWIVNCADESLSFLKDINDAKEATESLLYAFEGNPSQFDANLASDKSVEYYYKKLYNEKPKGFFDFVQGTKPSIFSLLAENEAYVGAEGSRYYLHQAFKTAGELFEVFDSNQQSVIVPWGEGSKVIELLERGSAYVTKETIEKAKPFTVSVFDYQFENLLECSGIRPIEETGIWVLDEDYYDDEIGIVGAKKGGEKCSILIL